MIIEHIGIQPDFIRTMAQWHFDQWKDLTGFPTLEGYLAFLERCLESTTIPYVLVAHSDGQLLGSVNLVACDMTIRPELTPWLAQLFVSSFRRGQGIGRALVQAAIEWTRDQKFEWLYLYTSGTLPHYYEHLGFRVWERVNYLGKERTVMEYNLIQ